MKAFTLALLFVLQALTITSAHADERAAAREHYYRGTKAFELGLYDEAIAEYMAAYKAKDDPALLYNIAQSHRLAGHPVEALRFYKVYLIKLPASSNRIEVESKIVELEKLVEQQKKAAHEMPPDQVKPLGAAPPAETGAARTEPAPAPAVEETSPAPSPAAETVAAANPNAGRTKKIAGLAVAAVGIAAVAAGIALEVLAKQSSDDLTAVDRAGGVYDPGKQSGGHTEDLAGAVLLGVGGAAAVAGVIVAVLGFRESRAERKVALTPLLSPQLAGAVLRVTF